MSIAQDKATGSQLEGDWQRTRVEFLRHCLMALLTFLMQGRQLDIYPDMLPDEEFRFSAAEYQDIIFKPKEEEVLQWLHDTGYRTAKHWAAQPQDPSTEEAGENA